MVELRSDEITTENSDQIMLEIVGDYKSFAHI
jgi:hypothetical protein